MLSIDLYAMVARFQKEVSLRKALADLELATLSHPRLEAMRRNRGAIEFATLGSGTISSSYRPMRMVASG